jgi:hypothetical protein
MRTFAYINSPMSASRAAAPVGALVLAGRA